MTQHIDPCETARMRVLAAALVLQQCTKTAANIVPIPGKGQIIVIGTKADVARLLELEPAAATTQASTAQAEPTIPCCGDPECNACDHVPVKRGSTPQHPEAPADGAGERYIPRNFTTHRAAWREALTFIRDASMGDGAVYWQHELDAYDRAFARLLDNPEPVRAAVTSSTDGAQAAHDVLAERRRQVEAEGWHPDQDDDYEDGQLSMAAACYAMQGSTPNYGPPPDWPWDAEWWKPTDDRRNLVKAGALILADIERIDRAAMAAPAIDGGGNHDPIDELVNVIDVAPQPAPHHTDVADSEGGHHD